MKLRVVSSQSIVAVFLLQLALSFHCRHCDFDSSVVSSPSLLLLHRVLPAYARPSSPSSTSSFSLALLIPLIMASEEVRRLCTTPLTALLTLSSLYSPLPPFKPSPLPHSTSPPPRLPPALRTVGQLVRRTHTLGQLERRC